MKPVKDKINQSPVETHFSWIELRFCSLDNSFLVQWVFCQCLDDVQSLKYGIRKCLAADGKGWRYVYVRKSAFWKLTNLLLRADKRAAIRRRRELQARMERVQGVRVGPWQLKTAVQEAVRLVLPWTDHRWCTGHCFHYGIDGRYNFHQSYFIAHCLFITKIDDMVPELPMLNIHFKGALLYICRRKWYMNFCKIS